MILSRKNIPANIKSYSIVPASKIIKATAIDVSSLKNNSQFINVCWRMVKTCIEHHGIGLSANQCGIQKRMFIIETSENEFKVFINPTWRNVIHTPWKLETSNEGCLSVAGKVVSVSRPDIIEASWVGTSLTGEVDEVSTNALLIGLLARVFQHETDHLDSKSILDYLNKK